MLTSAKRNMDVGPGNYAPSMVLVGWRRQPVPLNGQRKFPPPGTNKKTVLISL